LKNWLRNLILGLIFLALIALVFSDPVYGQSTGCPDGADCIDASNFDTDLDGWVAESATASWMESKTLSNPLGNSLANGVLHIYDYRTNSGSDPMNNAPGIYKSFYLQPGNYRIVVRAGQDLNLSASSLFVSARSDTLDWNWSSALLAWYYSNLTSRTAFTISSPGQVRIRVVTGANAYFDYIWLEKSPDGYPTATPSGPTITPGGPTAVPYSQQATPVPPGTAVCQAAPVSTIPAYATPSAYTGTTFSTLETFDIGSIYRGYLPWSKFGNVTINSGNDHTGGESSSASIQYDPHWNETSMASFDQALVMTSSYGQDFWINAWAQADVVPITQTAKMEVWQKISGTWELVVATTVSAQQWYPIHAAISAAATEVAFVAARSDLPSAGYILLDDVYVYAPESNMPYCDGTYPAGTIGIDDSNNVAGTQMQWPADKPCPGGIMQPNNMWGMILAQLTLFLDQQMAMSPIHVLGTTRDLAQQFMLGPIGGLIMLATIILDWNIPIIMLEAYIAFQFGMGVIGIWKLIRRAFIV
jgi:hypothetical protein